MNEGELLVVKSSGSKANILSGKTAICGPDRAGRIVASNFLLRLRVDESAAVPKYIWYVLNSGMSKAFVKTIVGASTYPNLKWSLYSSHPIPLPSLPRQQRIANILDKADALRTKRRAALAQLDELTHSIFLEMFGDPVTNPKGWPQSPLKMCTELIQIGPFGSLLHQEDYVSGGVPLINPKHIQDGKIRPSLDETIDPGKHKELKTYHLRTGDVIMGRRGEMGRCAVVAPEHEGYLCGTGSLFIRPQKGITTSSFLCFLLSTDSMKNA